MDSPSSRLPSFALAALPLLLAGLPVHGGARLVDGGVPPDAGTAVTARSTAAAPDAGVEACDDWLDRLYLLLGVPCVPTLNGTPRQEAPSAQTPLGSRLQVLHLPSGRERTLWECGGCSSPVRFQGGLAVLRPDGIWFVPVGSKKPKPRQLMAGPSDGRIRQLFSATADGKALVVIFESPGMPATLRVAHVAEGRLAPPPQGELRLERRVYRPNQLNDGALVLSGRLEEGGVLRLLRARPPDAPRLLFPPEDVDDGVDRFDAVWLSGSEVAYVASP